MIDILLTVFWGLVLLTIIVFVHELGHFLAARAFGLRVKEFMIGLPGPKLSFKRKDTSYGVTAIPLGGYCLIAGMEKGEENKSLEKALVFISYFGQVTEDEADRSSKELGIDLVESLDTLADWGTVRRFKKDGLYHYVISEATIDGVHYEEGEFRKIANPQAFLAKERKLTFNSLPWWKRVIVLLAGSLSNLIVAFGILVVVVMISGAQVYTTTIESVSEDSPALEVGLEQGDVLLSIDGKNLDSWKSFTDTVREFEVGDEIELGYERDGKKKSVDITLADNEGVPFVGVTPKVERQDVTILQAAEASVMLIGSVFQAILQLFNPATFSETINQTSSVVGISIEARNAADTGTLSFVYLIAALSISIGFFNLLPIPPLDGGKIIVETIERVMRRRIPVGIINIISLAGVAAMLALLFVATNADINRYFLGG